MTSPDQLANLRPAAKKATGYLFLPHAWSRGNFLKWLRRTHAWIGLWGATLGLLFGFSGILLNHRELMKIPAAKTEQHEFQLTLPEPRPADAEAMVVWLGEQLAIDISRAKIRREPPKTVIWNQTAIQQPALWQITVRNPKRLLQAEYWQGNAFVAVKQSEANLFAMLNNLHKGSGMNIAWVLLVDTLAGGLIVLSITGLLLWTGLHGSRLLALGLISSCLGLLVIFASQAILG